MKKIIHVAQQAIQQNNKDGGNRPAIIVRTYKGATRHHEVEFADNDGNVVGRIVHKQNDPLSCGAKVWVEIEGQVNVIA